VSFSIISTTVMYTVSPFVSKQFV